MNESVENKLFVLQPKSCRMPLLKKKIEWNEWQMEDARKTYRERVERVLFFNPTKLYQRIGHRIDPMKRHQGLQMEDLFPQPDRDAGKCTCGCRKKPKQYSEGKYMKYASESCNGFASDVLSIINNYFDVAKKYMTIYQGYCCAECSETTGLELDHTVGVKHGGGGSWLSNYRWLCTKCHRNKTNKDFGFKEHAVPQNQLKLI